jgi:4a-hydroxytetrahydrobiopterin dehydratase
MSSDLSQKKCVPCHGGIPALSTDEVTVLLKQVPDWSTDTKMLHKKKTFKDFVQLMNFVNKMADLAEAEGHHPDFTVHYNVLDITLWTHKVDGLTESDFILAAKIDGI